MNRARLLVNWGSWPVSITNDIGQHTMSRTPCRAYLGAALSGMPLACRALLIKVPAVELPFVSENPIMKVAESRACAGCRSRASTVTKAVALAVMAWLVLAIMASCVEAQGTDPGVAVSAPPAADEGFVMQILRNLFNSRALLNILSKPEFTLTAFVALNIIVFVETGLLVGFFLPGDSLLVTAGVACYMAGWDLTLLIGTLCLSAIIGDSVGYTIGRRTGPRIFNREKSLLFNKDHLLKAQAFYEKHGGKTIILARFMPIIRTFAPVVAGVGNMNYRKFLFFNVIGGVSWVVSMILIGYGLSTIINPAMRNILGKPQFDVQDHIEKVIILVVLLSISPGIYVWVKARMKKKVPPFRPLKVSNELVEAK